MSASSTIGDDLLRKTTCLADQNRGPHVWPSSTVVGKLREHRGRTLLGRRHDPEADDYRYKTEHVDAAEDSLCQRKMLCAEDIERSHCNDRNPSQQRTLPTLRHIVDVVNNNERLDQSTHDERINGDDRQPRDSREPPWRKSVESIRCYFNNAPEK